MKSQSTPFSAPLGAPNFLSVTSLRDANCRALEEGAEFLLSLPGECYRAHFKPVFQSTIGAHFRHVIEHYRCFLGQLESAGFNYDDRPRDSALEQDREYASVTIADLIVQLKALDFTKLNGDFEVVDHYAVGPIVTNLARELAFLHSHIVHHFALIAALARGLGVETRDDFGVAIATQCHQQAEASK